MHTGPCPYEGPGLRDDFGLLDHASMLVDGRPRVKRASLWIVGQFPANVGCSEANAVLNFARALRHNLVSNQTIREPRWPAFVAMLAAACVYLAMPRPLSVGPTWLLLAVIFVLL